MGKGFVQEKVQVTFPQKPRTDTGWVSDESARDRKGVRAGQHYARLPPGSDIEAQDFTDQRNMPTMTAGETDVSHDANPGAYRKGFTRRPMKCTDEMYTREQNPVFYDTIEVDGVEGFVERGNVLDRS